MEASAALGREKGEVHTHRNNFGSDFEQNDLPKSPEEKRTWKRADSLCI